MAKITKPLTDTEIKAAKAFDKNLNLYDGYGLILLVKTNGSKLWRYRYKHPISNKTVLLGIGRYPEMSLAEARKRRDEGNALLSTHSGNDEGFHFGIDPQTHWKEQKYKAEHDHLNTFEQVARAWHKLKSTEVSSDHATDIWRSIENNLLSSIGRTPIKELTAPKFIIAMSEIEARGAFETIRRLCQRINEIMNYATNKGLIYSNPAAGIKNGFQKPEKQNLPSISPDKLPELLQTIARANISLATRCVLEWQLHTMTRPSEAAGTRWDEIDLNNKTWTIPPERMKRKKSHTIPLSDQVLAILEVMKPITGNREFVFASAKNPRKPMHSQTANMALKRMGYHGKLVAHGLRSLASTTLNEHAYNPDWIEAALAHVDSNEVRRAYNRAEYLEQRRQMMNWWSEHIVNASMGSLSVATPPQTKIYKI